jgi:hypothetical protein
VPVEGDGVAGDALLAVAPPPHLDPRCRQSAGEVVAAGAGRSRRRDAVAQLGGYRLIQPETVGDALVGAAALRPGGPVGGFDLGQLEALLDSPRRLGRAPIVVAGVLTPPVTADHDRGHVHVIVVVAHRHPPTPLQPVRRHQLLGGLGPLGIAQHPITRGGA